MVEYLFVGVDDLKSISLKVITTMPDPLMLDSNTILYASTETSDWTVTTLNWMFAIKFCKDTSSSNLHGGQSIIFNYTLTNKDPLSMCSIDLSTVLLEVSGEQGYTVVWDHCPLPPMLLCTYKMYLTHQEPH
jgi:hypothetical protein